MLSVTRKPLSALVKEIYDTFGELHMAEYDWALTPKTREAIHRTLMVERRLPDFGLPVQRVSYLDGCKVYFENGWIIARFSGTEPRVRVFAEMETLSAARGLVRRMAEFVGLPFSD